MAFRKSEIEQAKELPAFDPSKKYTDRQLELYATKMLLEERSEIAEKREAGETVSDDGPMWLNQAQIDMRHRREIITRDGTPDPNIVQGIYNRTHPEGRKVNSDEQRKKNGAAFYR
jgi:hypothetical protein